MQMLLTLLSRNSRSQLVEVSLHTVVCTVLVVCWPREGQTEKSPSRIETPEE